VVAIANGAQASDAARLGYKIQAATTFTGETDTAGIDTSDPTFMSAAHAAVVNVVNDVGLNASMLATYNYTHPGGNVQLAGQAQDTTPGFLDTQARVNQIETLYSADFNRAGDGPGTDYWVTKDTHAPVQIAQSFLVQPEAASLPTTDIPAFIQSVYTNLFNRNADATGLAHWQTQITSGAASLGAATYVIANGAQGADQTVLSLKLSAAGYFTANTHVNSLGTTTPLDASS
jgi:hypothetical protein